MTNLKSKFLEIAPFYTDCGINFVAVVDGELCLTSEYEVSISLEREKEIVALLEAA